MPAHTIPLVPAAFIADALALRCKPTGYKRRRPRVRSRVALVACLGLLRRLRGLGAAPHLAVGPIRCVALASTAASGQLSSSPWPLIRACARWLCAV